MHEVLSNSEKRFLAWHRLSADDVFDARGMPAWLWKQRIREVEKTVALGTACKNGGHRLRTRSGHCVQCDPKKLAFQERHSARQYVYIAGSLLEKLIKIGTCKDVPQREGQMRAEKYGGISDWSVIFSILVRDAGRIEHRARSRISRYAVVKPYWKDGFRQNGIELLKCSFSQAKEALLSEIGDSKLAEPWKARYTSAYEFDENS